MFPIFPDISIYIQYVICDSSLLNLILGERKIKRDWVMCNVKN